MKINELLIDIDDDMINNKQNNSIEFLIYRPIKQKNNKDVGWYILIDFPVEKYNNILQNILNNEIICYFSNIDNNISMYITKTNIYYQLFYNFIPNKLIDRILYKSEKENMLNSIKIDFI